MLRISRLTDYAFILLNELDQAEGEIVSGSALAERAPLPLPTVRKVLKQLTQAGILVSHQGAHGGYELADPLEAVSVAEVISAMEGPIAVTLCSEGADECEIEEHCPTSRSWKVINAAIRSALEGLTLADMRGPLDAETVLATAGPSSTGSTPQAGGSPSDERRSQPI